jgi:hypothetical protein
VLPRFFRALETHSLAGLRKLAILKMRHFPCGIGDKSDGVPQAHPNHDS